MKLPILSITSLILFAFVLSGCATTAQSGPPATQSSQNNSLYEQYKLQKEVTRDTSNLLKEIF